MQVENIQKMDDSLFGEGLALLKNRCEKKIMVQFVFFYVAY